ncbi:MAG: hypothetical protein IPF94_11090 [Betaproteobacteria bacterium]|nr:hypothetical protein [Betaproteobacteria bacterium]
MNTDKTTILPSSSVAKDGFLDQKSFSVEKALYAGDPVFALGELRRDLPPLAGVSVARCQLAPFGGVLLVSGGSEREARVLHNLWFAVQAPLALLCFGLLVFGTWAHMVGYPPGDDGPAATFFESLRTTPWKSEAGPAHPLWIKDRTEQDGAEPRSD